MFNKFLIAMMLITSTQSFAGQDGNGGFGIKCGDKIEVLDLYEARTRYGYTVDLGAADESVDNKVYKMLARLKKVNWTASATYMMRYQKLWERAKILEGQTVVKNDDALVGSDLTYKSDIGSAILPDDCALTPLARNITESGSDLKENIFFIGKHWKQLDNDNKAALIMHELIYFDYVSGNMREYGYSFDPSKGSSPVRQMVAFLSSKEADTATMKTIFETFFYHNDKYGAMYPRLFYYESNKIFIKMYHHISFATNENEITNLTVSDYDENEKTFTGKISYQGNTYQYLNIFRETKFLRHNFPKAFYVKYFNFNAGNLNYNVQHAEVELYNNGSVKRVQGASLSIPPVLNQLLDTGKIKFAENLFGTRAGNRVARLEFYPNGQVRCAGFRDPVVVDLKSKLFSVRTQEVQLDLNGNIIAEHCYENKNENN